MSRSGRSALVAVLATMTCAPVALAQSSVSFADDFNGCTTTTGLGQRWETFGIWYCRSDRARGESPNGFALPKVSAVQDTDVQARVQLNGESNGSGVVARWTDATHFYAARIFTNVNGSSFITVSRTDGGTEVRFATVPAPIVRNTSFLVRLVATGGAGNTRLQAFLNGTRVIDIVDGNLGFATGRAGLFNGGTPGTTGFPSRSQFDDFTFTGTTLAVSFADNFDACTATSGLGPRWTVQGLWYCKSGRARGESTLGFALAKTPVLTDTDVSAKVQLNGSSNASGVVARWSDAGNYYAARVFVNATGPAFVDVVRVDGGTPTVLGHAVYDHIERNFSNTVRLVVFDSGPSVTTLDLFVDGHLLIEATDTSGRRPDGLAGLLSGGDGQPADTGFVSRSQFDDFVLASP